ncbi:serine/threonine protein kinase [Ktedonosporobacter rubrisoli]|uniref:non-specific serine/threonine protein kinase n=1 Tax=Ktedonosporobacter rubrisoli TaxID=2509675 RepID=A0A4P6K4A7_KTERU|nr:serine/threonine-protein kinase [Ktedonosporobacter rubrisoli]QBD83138.1 serine/threonine protein kinase [Ktedonosporobacter rubrisoli]
MQISRWIGKYRPIKLLGRGDFSEVYLAEDPHLQTQVAIKVLNPHANSNVHRLFNESIRTMARMDHAHIISVHDFGEQNNAPFCVMAYAACGSIRQWLQDVKSMPLKSMVTYVKQIAKALQYAHDLNIVHQRLKPENILLDEEGSVLLSDFGPTEIRGSLLPSLSPSALRYMAPEQIMGRAQALSDQYVLGLIIYEWLMGAPPFTGAPTEVFEQQMKGTPASLREKIPALSSLLEEVVMIALSKDPKNRFARINSFAFAFEQAARESLSNPGI